MKYPGLSGISLILLLAACDTGSQGNTNREALQEEIRNREPKKVKEAEIISEAFEKGKFLASEAQKTLITTLHKVVEKEGTAKAVQYCNIQAHPLLDSLSEKYNADIRRTSLKPRNPANAPNETEKQLLEAYQYSAENDLALTDNVQRLENNYLLYTKPIILESGLCLKCHGEPGKDMEEETLKAIERLYPQDKARHYRLKDFRGIWSIRLSQKELVNAL